MFKLYDNDEIGGTSTIMDWAAHLGRKQVTQLMTVEMAPILIVAIKFRTINSVTNGRKLYA